MAVTSGSRIQFEYMLGGGPPPIVVLPEANDATGWDQGTVLILDSSGHLTKAASGNCATGMFAVAMHPMQATADGSETASAILITPFTVFSAVVAHGTTASAKTEATQVGKCFLITNSATICPSTNVYIMEVETTSLAGGYCIGNKDATGTAYGRNYFIFRGIYANDSPWLIDAS